MAFEAIGSKLCVITEVVISGLAPDHGLPEGGDGAHVPDMGAHPEHPIYFPPEVDIPEFPTPPIVIPPGESVPDFPFEVYTGWTPEQGWVVVLVPTGDHVVPSRG